MSATFKPEDTRPFNLEHAKAGAPVCQRSGYPATILKFDVKGEFPIAGILVIDHDEEIGAWRSDGSFYDKGEDDLYDIGLVMKPLAYIDGRPVHYGDKLTRNMGAGYISTIEAFPELDFDSGEFAWPETINLKDHAPVATVTSDTDRDDFLSMFSENTIREVARRIRGKAGASISVEVVLGVIGETADHRIIQTVDTLKIKGVTPPPAVADAVTLTMSDIQHVVWAYLQLAGSRFGLDSTVAHMTALREIAVKHGGLVEAKGKAPEPVLSLKPLRDYQQAAVDAMNQSFVDAILPGHEVTMVAGTGNSGEVIDDEPKASIDFIDTILPKDFPVKFAVPDSQFEQAVKEALTVPPELLKAPVDPIVVDTSKVPPSLHGGYVLHHKFDDFIPWSGSECPVAPDQVVRVRLRYGAEWQGRADDINWSHTDSRVSEGNQVVGYKLMHKKEIVDPIKQLEWENTELIASNKALNEANMQQAERIRQLIEANTALEDRVRAHLEDNAKLEAMNNDQIAETGRWMAEAKKLGDTVESLSDKLNNYRSRVDELNSRLSKIAAYVRDDVEAVRRLPLSQYRAAILSKVID